MEEKTEKLMSKESRVSAYTSPMTGFEGLQLSTVASKLKSVGVPPGFFFLVGTPLKGYGSVDFHISHENFMIQGFYPHSSNQNYRCQKRRYGAFWVGFEPPLPSGPDDETASAKFKRDDVVMNCANIYECLENNQLKLAFLNGEWRKRKPVTDFFNYYCQKKKLQPFGEPGKEVGLYRVTFKKSCSYFLKGRTYFVWAMPVGIPDNGCEVRRGWVFCDVNCGVPAQMLAEREEMEEIPWKTNTIINGRLRMTSGKDLTRDLDPEEV